MLQSLRIRNLALLEEVTLDFEPGFTAVTGETGAGKSILLGALSLLAGERADKSVIRQGEPACEVEASLHFVDPLAINAILAALELPLCEDGLLLLRRSIARDKPPRITVNGALATLAALQQIGEQWIDFHGPSEPRRLLRESCQLELLDLFGRAAGALAGYLENYQRWRGLQAERVQLVSETRLSEDQVDFLKNQLAKFDALDLTEEAIGNLERDFQRVTHSQEIAELTGSIAAGIDGEEGVQRRLGELLRLARQLGEIDPTTLSLAERLSAAAVELNDLGAEFASITGRMSFDPEHAENLTNRMNTWLELKRRHGGSLQGVFAARDELKARLGRQGDIDGILARLNRDIAAADVAMRQEARELRSRREKAAKELTRIAARTIAELGFRKADFQVRIIPLPEPGPAGDCSCEFLFSPNVGEPPLSLNRVASSGELARVMLALKAVLADLDGVPLLVFDEVDANVGGEIGGVVGQKLAAVARQHQVLCVTHLPQVAARAGSHLVVSKDQSRDRAVVTIAPIQSDRPARISELARMLGDRKAKSALAHAEELLAG